MRKRWARKGIRFVDSGVTNNKPLHDQLPGNK